MTTKVVGSLVNQLTFKIDKSSWNNLTKFQGKLRKIKDEMTGLKGGITIKSGDISRLAAASKKINDAIEKSREIAAKKTNARIAADMNRRTRKGGVKSRLSKLTAAEERIGTVFGHNLKRLDSDRATAEAMKADKIRADHYQKVYDQAELNLAMKRRKEQDAELKNIEDTKKARQKAASDLINERTKQENKFNDHYQKVYDQAELNLAMKRRKEQDAETARRISDNKKIADQSKKDRNKAITDENKADRAKFNSQMFFKQMGGRTLSSTAQKSMALLKAEADGLHESFNKATDSAERYSHELDRIHRRARLVASQSKTLNQRFLEMRHNILGLGVAGTGVAATAGLVNTGQAFEALSIKMLAATGSSDKAAEAMSLIRKESTRLGMGIIETADSYARLGIAAKDKLTEPQLNELFVAYSEIGTAYKLTRDEMKRGQRSLEQMLN